MGHKSEEVEGLDAKGGDLKLRQMATEALGLVEALAALELEGNALLAAELLDDLGGHRSTRNEGSTDFDRFAFAAKQNVESKFGRLGWDVLTNLNLNPGACSFLCRFEEARRDLSVNILLTAVVADPSRNTFEDQCSPVPLQSHRRLSDLRFTFFTYNTLHDFLLLPRDLAFDPTRSRFASSLAS